MGRKRKSKKKPVFKVLRGFNVLYRGNSKKQTIDCFKTFVIINKDPTTVCNSHGTIIYDRHSFEKQSPELFKIFPNFKVNGVFS